MSTLQIRFENTDQWEQVLGLLRKLKLDFRILEKDEDWADSEADQDPNDAYKAAQSVLADEWNHPENDVWDNL